MERGRIRTKKIKEKSAKTPDWLVLPVKRADGCKEIARFVVCYKIQNPF